VPIGVSEEKVEHWSNLHPWSDFYDLELTRQRSAHIAVITFSILQRQSRLGLFLIVLVL